MTLHSAKGLEFPTVVLAGLVDGNHVGVLDARRESGLRADLEEPFDHDGDLSYAAEHKPLLEQCRGELAALYDAFNRRQPAQLRTLPLQYADYVIIAGVYNTSKASELGKVLDEIGQFPDFAGERRGDRLGAREGGRGELRLRQGHPGHRPHQRLVRRVRRALGAHDRLPDQHHAETRRDEAGSLRAHAAGARTARCEAAEEV